MEYIGILGEMAGLAKSMKSFADYAADWLGITSKGGRIALTIGLFIVAMGFLFVMFNWGIKLLRRLFGKKGKPITNPEAAPEEQFPLDDINTKLQERHEIVILHKEISHTLHMSERNDTLHFEWLSRQLVGREYEAHLVGTIEGRINYARAEVKADPTKINMFEEIIVNVYLPAGYFIVNFDLGDIEQVVNTAGLFAKKYELPDIQRAFDEQYRSIVRECIENENMIAQTKDNARRDVEGFIGNLMEELGFKNVPGFKKYEVKVTFTGKKWHVSRGAKKLKQIDTIKDIEQ